MNYLDRRNIDCLLQWRQRWHRDFQGLCPWPAAKAMAFEVRLEVKRLQSLCWLKSWRGRRAASTTNIVQFRRNS
jgi:hypothetical protein